jgi:PilZ domain
MQHVTNSIKRPRDSQISRKRRFLRFRLQYPVHLKIESPTTVYELDSISRDVSIGGVLLETAFVIPHHSRVSFTIKITEGKLVRPIELEGEGEVVRVESRPDKKFRIAVACQSSIRYGKIVQKRTPHSLTSHAAHNPATAELSAGSLKLTACSRWLAPPTI